MREILFRGKRKDNGKWVEGHYGEYYSGKEKVSCISISKETISGSLYYDVIPKTVGQYTGLCDKNGVKIFEGDILQGNEYPYYSDGKYNYYAEVVFFDDDCFAAGFCTHKNPKAKVKGISDGNCELIEDFISDNWLVIGNIYDNPELVEVIVNE